MELAEDQFDDLLDWLDSNRETAGHKYETIRLGLIRIFISQGFNDAEDLTDVTINRVGKKLPEIRADYVGEPARYFHGVARNIIREARRRPEIASEIFPADLEPEVRPSDKYDCLLYCLKELPKEKSELILEYYSYNGRDKKEQRKRMADELGITVGALRSRAHHIRDGLEDCVLMCIKKLREKQKPS